MTIFDDAFINTIRKNDIHKFDAWIKHWGVECVVERTRKHEHMANKRHWIEVLINYFPTMQKWMVSDLCAQTDAEYMFDCLFDQFINIDHNGSLAKKCNTVFAKHMFKTQLSLWKHIPQIVGKHHNEVLLHLLQHSDFQTHLTSERNAAQEGMRNMFLTMIVSSRNVEKSSWQTFRENMPAYHRSWLVPYIDSLLAYRFDNVVNELLESVAFQRWNANGEFLKEWAQRHNLNCDSGSENMPFLDPDTQPIYCGTLLWNSIAREQYNENKDPLKLFHSSNIPIEDILLNTFLAAERSVKNLSVEKKAKRLRQAEKTFIAIFDGLSDQALDNLIPHKTAVWDWCNISNHPRVSSRVLHTAVTSEGRISVGRKI